MQNPTSDKSKDTVRLDLTAEQSAQVKERIGKDAEAIELGVDELEQRIAPRFKAL